MIFSIGDPEERSLYIMVVRQGSVEVSSRVSQLLVSIAKIVDGYLHEGY